MTQVIGRARPMTPDDRRESIIDAIMPLLLERGRDITSREMADAAGVAEGTIFRAFGDKDSVIDAAVERFLDPEKFRRSLAEIEVDWPMERKLAAVITSMQARMKGTMGILAVVGYDRRPPEPGANDRLTDFLTRVLAPDLDRLRVPIADVAYYLRLAVFASSIEQFNQDRPFSVHELTRFVLYGVAGKES